jgi:hypothetical protein
MLCSGGFPNPNVLKGIKKSRRDGPDKTASNCRSGKVGKFREIFEGQINFKRGKCVSVTGKLTNAPKENLVGQPQR